MTRPDAFRLARRKWGRNARVERVGALFRVGVVRNGVFRAKGEGADWVDAFEHWRKRRIRALAELRRKKARQLKK